jgi:hypothetical protein
MRLPNGLPADLPEDFAAAHARHSFTPAEPQEPARFDTPVKVSGASDEMLERAWAPARRRYQEIHERIRRMDPGVAHEMPAAMEGEAELAGKARRIIGITGRAGAGKNAVASMIPGAFVIGMADPLYAMLAAMLGIPEPLLRQRECKESVVPWLGKSVREMLQTLGTEWGRGMVCSDVWLRLLARRLGQLAEQGISIVAVADVRFENEVEYLRSLGGEVWHVRRPGVDGPTGHSSEDGVAVAPGDVVIDNAGTLDGLRMAVMAAIGAAPVSM